MKPLATVTVDVVYENNKYIAYYQANNSVEFIVTKAINKSTGEEIEVGKMSADFYNLIDNTITNLRGNPMEKKTEFPPLQLGDTVRFGQYKGNTMFEIATDSAVKPTSQGDYRKRDNTKSWINYLEGKQSNEGKSSLFHPTIIPFVAAYQKLKKVSPDELNRVLTKMAEEMIKVAQTIPDDEPAVSVTKEKDAF